MNTKRKGAKSIKDIPENVLNLLNAGAIETVNLVEWLAVDQCLLLKNLLAQTNRDTYLSPILLSVNALTKHTVNTLNETIGIGLLKQSMLHQDEDLIQILSKHPSDIVRCWAAYATNKNHRLSLAEKFENVKTFAMDEHFGVREVAWLSLRSSIAANLAESIQILSTWVNSEHPYIRRFASESTRPRGVWCQHIPLLKQQPALALSIIEPLKADKVKYVQDSVGNWLNDASKSQPSFVLQLCERWATENASLETAYIIKKALRTIKR